MILHYHLTTDSLSCDVAVVLWHLTFGTHEHIHSHFPSGVQVQQRWEVVTLITSDDRHYCRWDDASLAPMMQNVTNLFSPFGPSHLTHHFLLP